MQRAMQDAVMAQALSLARIYRSPPGDTRWPRTSTAAGVPCTSPRLLLTMVSSGGKHCLRSKDDAEAQRQLSQGHTPGKAHVGERTRLWEPHRPRPMPQGHAASSVHGRWLSRCRLTTTDHWVPFLAQSRPLAAVISDLLF